MLTSTEFVLAYAIATSPGAGAGCSPRLPCSHRRLSSRLPDFTPERAPRQAARKGPRICCRIGTRAADPVRAGSKVTGPML